MSFSFVDDKLSQLSEQHLRRYRHTVSSAKDGMIEIEGKHYINFASNDYLGLSQNEQVLQAYVEGLAVYGSGSGASSLVTGYGIEHKALEDDLCEILNKPAALLFSSGFAANQALCHALFSGQKGKNRAEHIICDKYMHASFIQGAIDSSAELSRFKHNDINHAATLIEKAHGDVLIATEGVFSMDGDYGKISELQNASKSAKNENKEICLMVDDAHAIGVVGAHGFGSLDTKDVQSEHVDIVMGTFGKALGTGGAFVAGSRQFIDFLINTSKHYIYSTAISQAQARATRVSLSLVEIGKEREKLLENIVTFKALAKQHDIKLLPSDTAIQPLLIGDPKQALTCCEGLKKLGLWVPAIRTPTVPKHSDRLRITLSALHTEQDIKALIDGIEMVIMSSTNQDVSRPSC